MLVLVRERALRKEEAVAFEDVVATVGRWVVATEALAALGAELSLMDASQPADTVLVDALRGVSAAAGLSGLGELAPRQRRVLAAFIRLSLHQAVDLVDEPRRPPGWTFTDTAILEGCGRGSMVVPGALLASAPELAEVRSLLDVGTGVGMLAIAAAAAWPKASIVGIDVWRPSLDAARRNVHAAGLDDRITVREQDVTALDDVEEFDCAWLPTFFLSDAALDAALPRLFRSVHPGGWIVLGRMAPPPDRLAEATTLLRAVGRRRRIRRAPSSRRARAHRLHWRSRAGTPRPGPARVPDRPTTRRLTAGCRVLHQLHGRPVQRPGIEQSRPRPTSQR